MRPTTASADEQQTHVYFTGMKTLFSHICNLMVPIWKLNSFAMETPSE